MAIACPLWSPFKVLQVGFVGKHLTVDYNNPNILKKCEIKLLNKTVVLLLKESH